MARAANINVNADENSGIVGVGDVLVDVTTTFPHIPSDMCEGTVQT